MGAAWSLTGREMLHMCCGDLLRSNRGNNFAGRNLGREGRVKRPQESVATVPGKSANIYIDSKYQAFMIVHAHGVIWRERGLLKVDNIKVWYAKQVLELLEEIKVTREIAVMHFPGHQCNNSEMVRSNAFADLTTRYLASASIEIQGPLIP